MPDVFSREPFPIRSVRPDRIRKALNQTLERILRRKTADTFAECALARLPGPRGVVSTLHSLGGRAPRGLVRFLIVGVGGLSVDLAILSLLERAGVGHAVARVASLGVATLATWALNRRFTFGESGRDTRGELGRYALVALLAQSVNYAVFLALCAGFSRLPHLIAAVIGAVAATAFSYSGQRFFTFAPESERPVIDSLAQNRSEAGG